MMGMSSTKIGGGDGVLICVDGCVKLEGVVGSLLIEASSTCNLAFLRGGRPSVHGNYNNPEAKVMSVNCVVNFNSTTQFK
jgi:hypothetical protein